MRLQGSALSMEKVLDHLNGAFDPLIAEMSAQLTRLGAEEAAVMPLAEKVCSFLISGDACFCRFLVCMQCLCGLTDVWRC